MLTPAAFRELVVKRRDSCVKFKNGQPSRDRREAMQFYRGDNLSLYGDSGDGLSTVVSRDTMEAIEGMMPPLIRPFVAGEEVVSFDPVEAQDEEGAKQATEYVNHVFRRHNNVLSVAQTGLKDGLLFRLGVAKTVMEECEEGGPEQFADLTQEELDTIDPARIAGDIGQDPATGLFNVTLAPKKVKKFRVHIIAPDEFLYEERLSSLGGATFVGHTKQATLGDLIAMGLDETKCKALSSGEPDDERDDRFKDESTRSDEGDWQSDDLARPVWVDECYIRCDYQGDGTLEWRKAILGGSGKELLLDEAADDHPYSAWTPIPIPHKLVGLSIHDLTRDVQMQKTALQREMLNNLYLVNRPQREVLDGKVNMDDLMQPALNGSVRVKEMNSIRQLVTPFVAEKTFGMIEYQDSVREARTGVTRYNQGMDANSLNKTATGMNIIASNSQQRQELVARQFGEFLKDVFEKLLALVTQHAAPEDVAKLRGEFVPWPSEIDAIASVGLGTNNKDQLVSHLMALLQTDAQIVGLQQGVNGPLLTAPDIYEKLRRLPEAMGLKGSFYTDPSAPAEEAQGTEAQPEQPTEPDPMAEAQIKAQTDIQIAQMQEATKVTIARMEMQSRMGMLPGDEPEAYPETAEPGMMAA